MTVTPDPRMTLLKWSGTVVWFFFEIFAEMNIIKFENFAFLCRKNFEERKFSSRITNERYLIYTKDYAREESVKYLPAYLAFFL